MQIVYDSGVPSIDTWRPDRPVSSEPAVQGKHKIVGKIQHICTVNLNICIQMYIVV